jgi:hypothetical protein
MKTPSRRQLAIVQGLFLFFSGMWPLISMDSFLYVTGPKTDLWLVTMVGILLAIIGVVLSICGIRDRLQVELVLLGITTAASLASVDILFVVKRTISAVYLLDAMVEIGFLVLWVKALILQNSREHSE